MSTPVGDLAELRKRKATETPKEPKAPAPTADDGPEPMDDYTREYVEYFRSKYGDNPRSDILGIDGVPLFCLIYIVVAGVVLSLLYFSVYARNRTIFHPAVDLK